MSLPVPPTKASSDDAGIAKFQADYKAVFGEKNGFMMELLPDTSYCPIYQIRSVKCMDSKGAVSLYGKSSKTSV